MSSKLVDRSAKIVAVENSGAARQLLTEVVKNAGFGEVDGVGSIGELVTYLETNSCDWIIAGFSHEGDGGADSVNTLSLMQLCTVHPDLRNIRFCLLAEEAEQRYLPKAFELGLVAWYAQPFTKESFEKSFNEFLETAAKFDGQEDLIAASYLRPVLRKHQTYSDWIKMEQNLLDLHPGNADLLLAIAEPYHLSGEDSRAVAVLKQAKMLNPSISERADALIGDYRGASDPDQADDGEQSEVNVLGLTDVVIVDSDETIQNSLREIFSQNGVKNISCFSDGEAAAAFIKENPNPGLVVHEWRLPKLTGPLFVQKIISDGATTTPIILLSSLIQGTDMPLLKEMGISTIVNKPFESTDFLRSLIWTLQEDRLPTDQGVTEMKIRKLLTAGKKSEAEPLIAKFLADVGIPSPRKKLIEAEWAYYNRDYEAARDSGLAALKGSGESINVLNILGKSFMQLRDFASALKCLEKAQALSPKNIERLCQIAESESELGKAAQADEALEMAKDLDPNAQQVAETEIKMAMNKGEINAARSMMSEMDQLDRLVAYMNNKAIALARCNEFDKSIEQYQRTIEALPEARQELRSLVCYNLALALARAGELDESLKYVELALKAPHEKITTKAGSLKNRLAHAIKKGAGFHLNSRTNQATLKDSASTADQPTTEDATPPANPPANPGQFILSSLTAAPGDIGCFLVYTPEAEIEGSELLKSIEFSKRTTSQEEPGADHDGEPKIAS